MTNEPEDPQRARDDFDALLTQAREVARLAYVPYSGFSVGAAAYADDGRLVTGCNVENASYGMTLCAECGLISALAASGGGTLRRFVCVGGEEEPRRIVMPCGRCRQLLAEHAAPDFRMLSPAGEISLEELLPQAFRANDLERFRED